MQEVTGSSPVSPTTPLPEHESTAMNGGRDFWPARLTSSTVTSAGSVFSTGPVATSSGRAPLLPEGAPQSVRLRLLDGSTLGHVVDNHPVVSLHHGVYDVSSIPPKAAGEQD